MTKTLLMLCIGLLVVSLVERVEVKPSAVAAEPELRIDVDVWAGLSTPHREPRPASTKRAEAKTCLALNAFYEARGEPYEGQVAVNQVALRRAGFDVSRVCAEIYRPAQFSWTEARPHGSGLPTGDAWQWALAAAEQALVWSQRGEGPDFSEGATHFHAHYVRPSWSRNMEPVVTHGQHQFFAKTAW